MKAAKNCANYSTCTVFKHLLKMSHSLNNKLISKLKKSIKGMIALNT